MALVLADRVRDTTTTTGTGTITLSGTAPTGYQTFGAAIGNTNTTYYTINAGSQWEVGIGTYSSVGTTLSRDTVLASSNAGALVNFATGTKDVFVTYPAEKSVNQDASGNVGIGTTAPNSKLEVYGGSVRATLAGASAATFRGYSMASDSTEFASLKAESSLGETRLTSGFSGFGGFSTFYTNGSERMRISSAGDVGIGTSSPSSFSGYTSLTVSNATNGGLIEATNGTRTIRMQSQASGSALIGTTTSHNLGIMTASVERVTIDTSGNVGIGATPSAWSGVTALQMASSSAIGFNNQYGEIDSNAYYNAGYKYIGTGLAAKYSQEAGLHKWYTAPSGTAGAAISFTQAMTLDASANLYVDGGTGKGRITLENGASVNTIYSTTTAFGAYNTLNLNGSQHTFQTSGSERMRIDSAGKVGIGTSAPWELLSVPFNNGIALGSSTYSFKIQRSSAGELVTTFSDTYDASTARVDFTMRSGAAAQNTPLSILGSGNVGIATTTPQRPLHVYYGGATVGGYTAILQSFTGGYGAGVSFQSNLTGGSLAEMARITADGEDAWNTTASTQDAGLRFYTALDGTVAEKMRIDRNGSVGIGTSTMFDKLNVYGTAASISVDTPTSTDNNGFVIRSVNTERGSLRMQGNIGLMTLTAGYAGYGGILAINTNGSERMRVDTGGNVLVGTTTSRGRITVEAASGNCRAVNVLTGSSIMDQFYFNGTATGNISTNGVTAAYNTSSDARLKHDIVDAPQASSLIDAIQVRSFKWNADNSEQRYGMIAQELLQVAPEAVHQPADPDQMMGVDYSKLVPMLIKEVQSLRARVAQLEGK